MTRRIVVSEEGDGAFPADDVATRRRDRAGKDFQWIGRACKIYTLVEGERKMIARTGVLTDPEP